MTTEIIRLEKLYAKGELVWQDKNEWDSIPLSTSNDSNSNDMMVSTKDFVYVYANNTLYQFDSHTGILNWSINTTKVDMAYCSLSANENYVGVHCCNVNGNPGELWIFDSYSNEVTTIETPILTGNDYKSEVRLLILEDDTLFLLGKKYEINKDSIDLVWESNSSSSSPFYFDGYLYCIGSKLSRIDYNTGEVIYQSPRTVISPTKGFFCAAEDKLYLTDLSGTTEYSVSTTSMEAIRKFDASVVYLNKDRSFPGFESLGRIFMRGLIEASNWFVAGAKLTDNLDFIMVVSPASLEKFTYISKGENDHIYLMTDKKLKKRKLSKTGAFNLELPKEDSVNNITQIKNNAHENSGWVI